MFSYQRGLFLTVRDQVGNVIPSKLRWRQFLCFLSLFLLASSTIYAQDQPAPAQPVLVYKTLPIHPALQNKAIEAQLSATELQLETLRRERNVNPDAARQIKQVQEAIRSLKKQLSDIQVTRNNVASQIREILRNESDQEPNLENEETRKKFDAWFSQYIFASMTQPENLATLDLARQKFLRQDLGAAKRAHDYLLTTLTLPQMKDIVRGNYHPAVRYNAMLIIANLNKVEAPTTGQRAPPIPLIDALVVMVEELQNDKQTDAVRLAAWIGVLRHAQLNRIGPQIPPEGVKIIRDISTKLLREKLPPVGRSLSGHVWMQRRAIEVLAAIGTVGATEDIVAQIEAFTADEKAPMALRLSAARSMGKLHYAAGTKIKPDGAATQLGALAAFVCRAEMNRVDREKLAAKEAEEGTSGNELESMTGEDEGMDGNEAEMAEMFGDPEGAGGGSAGGNLSEQQIEELYKTKRMLKYQLYHVQLGLGNETDNSGLFAVADPAGRVQVKRISDMVTGILTELEPPDPEEGQRVVVLDRDQLLQKLRKQVRQLEAMTVRQSASVSPKPADTAIPGVDDPAENK